MKIALVSLLVVALAIVGFFILLAMQSKQGSAPGLHNARLSPCPNKPNCINTEFPDDGSHFTEALNIEGVSAEKLRQLAISSIESGGGKIIQQDAQYIAATYSSSLFRFVDDFEIRIDNEQQQLHIRSASRVGHSDLGANLKRVKAFKQTLKAKL